jgi:methyl-accepting chemotaxis protein
MLKDTLENVMESLDNPHNHKGGLGSLYRNVVNHEQEIGGLRQTLDNLDDLCAEEFERIPQQIQQVAKKVAAQDMNTVNRMVTELRVLHTTVSLLASNLQAVEGISKGALDLANQNKTIGSQRLDRLESRFDRLQDNFRQALRVISPRNLNVIKANPGDFLSLLYRVLAQLFADVSHRGNND